MAERIRSNLVIGLVAVAVAVLLLAVWIPLDTDTGLIERVRRRITIGDALAPSLAATFLLLGGAMLALAERRAPDQPRPGAAALGHVGAIIGLLALATLAMRHAGPAAVRVFGPEGAEYRLLRDTVPWKHLGFLLGGTAMVAGLIALVEGRATWQAVLVGLLATLAMIALYDLPFEDLLLPPNGDV